jgi:hypothetical protein
MLKFNSEEKTMPQKTFVNQELEKLDIEVNDFALRQDVDVFATHTDMIEFKESLTHKATVFFTLVSEKKAGMQTSKPVVPNKYPPRKDEQGRTEIGAGWESKKDPNQISVKRINGEWFNVDAKLLKLNPETGELEFENKSTGTKSYFVSNISNNPKAPIYRVFGELEENV